MFRRRSMAGRQRNWRGLLSNLLLRWNLSARVRPTPENFRKIDHPANTRKIGLRFTEKLRDNFRPRWLKLHRKD
ncbi:MAG: hypothetical protein JW860_01620 [Sedimentisphaerales bacterium]|nr:hypothetical protein [Sedimentisphaerales bacterium]